MDSIRFSGQFRVTPYSTNLDLEDDIFQLCRPLSFNFTGHHKGDYVLVVPNDQDQAIRNLFSQYGIGEDQFQYRSNDPYVDKNYATQGVPDFAAAFPLYMERQ